MTAPSATPSSSGIFDRWANLYDHQSNPVIALEERTLPALMPCVTGADVLDIGCGTGRWLCRLEGLSPKSLTGLDYSPVMLKHARLKLAPHTTLHLRDASSLPNGNNSVDMILATFVLSYIADLSTFADNCANVLRPGGHLLLSDIHPVTSGQREWTRAFHAGDDVIQLPAIAHSLDDILSAFANSGLHFVQLVEPGFEESERPLFEQASKLAEYDSLSGTRAIYLLKLQKEAFNTFDLNLNNAPWSANALTWNASSLSVENGHISIQMAPNHCSLNLSGYALLPGLINAHDHLELALFPNMGRTPAQSPFHNATEWANEIHRLHAEAIAQHLQVPLDTRVWWGAIRNLLAGVTTVCHHNPLYPALAASDFPIRVLSNFGWAHSLAFDPDLVAQFRSTPPHYPFILHAAEGTDTQSRNEITLLDRLDILCSHTVLVHGLALGPQEVTLLNKHGAAVIFCPTSNHFLFHQGISAEFVATIAHKALGSDSSLTARGDLLDELHYLHGEQIVDPELLYGLVTTDSADVLRLSEGEGFIAPKGRADFIAVRDIQASPSQTLVQLTSADIELVVIAGRVQVASQTLYARLPQRHRFGLHPLEIEGVIRYVRAPLPHLFESAERVLGPGNLRLGNKEVRHLSAL